MPNEQEEAMAIRVKQLEIALLATARAVEQECSDAALAMGPDGGRGWDPDAHLQPIVDALRAARAAGEAAGLELAARMAETWGHAPPNPHGRRAALAAAIRAIARAPQSSPRAEEDS